MNVKNGNSDKYKDELTETGLNIGYIRRKRGLTQEQLAEKANISTSFLSQIEAPNFPVSISLPTLFAIAEALDVDAWRLLRFNMEE